MKNNDKKIILRESVLTRIVNKAIVTGDVYVADNGHILFSDTEDHEPTSVRTSTSLPSLPRQRDVKTQTESLVGNKQFRCRPSKRPFSSLNIHRQYRVSPKTKPAPPPPPSSSLYPHHDPSLDTPSWSEEKPPPIPPPPPSRSPPPLHAYCDNPSSFSYGYTSPISTLNLDSSFTFSSPTSSKRIYPKKSKAPQPPSLSSNNKFKAWKLIPLPKVRSYNDINQDTFDGPDVDSCDSANLTIYVASPVDQEEEEDKRTVSSSTRPGTPRVITPRPSVPDTWSLCDTDTTINYSIVSFTRPPSFLFKFRKTIEDLDIEKLLGIRDVYMKTLMNSNYKDIFYTKEQIEKAVTSAYPDIHREILSDGNYKGERLHRILRCCYDNLSGEIVLPCTVIMDYITPVNPIQELVFVSRSDISKHLQLPDTVDRLLLVTDVNKRTTVDPEYIEFATQESAFLAMVKKKVDTE